MEARSVFGLGWCAVMLFGAGACAPTGPSPLQFAVRQVHGVDRPAVFRQAESVLIDMGYHIRKSDLQDGVLTTEPVRLPLGTRVPRQRASLSHPRAVREIAEVRVLQTAEALNVYCKVVVQEVETEAHRMFVREHDLSDSPGETPIEREAATSTEQNTVWRTINRDRLKERRILTAILELSEAVPENAGSEATP